MVRVGDSRGSCLRSTCVVAAANAVSPACAPTIYRCAPPRRAIRLSKWAPHPIACFYVGDFADSWAANCASVVAFVPPDRVKDIMAGIGAAVSQRLAIDDVVGEFGDELRGERIQGFGKLSFRQAVALQRARDYGLVRRGL